MVAADGWVTGLVSVGSPTAFNVAMGGWKAGAVSVGCPTAINLAVGGWAVGTVGVGSPTPFYVAVGGWAAGNLVAEISVLHGCRGSKMLAPIRANQGKDGGCTGLSWICWLGRHGIGRWVSGIGRWSSWCCLLGLC